MIVPKMRRRKKRKITLSAPAHRSVAFRHAGVRFPSDLNAPMPQPPPTPKKPFASTCRRPLSLALSLFLLAEVASVAAKERPRYALVYGSVFDDRGMAFRGARLIVTRLQPNRPGTAAVRGKRRWEGVSDARGEFAIRLPAGKGSYLVAVEAAGYNVQPQTVEIQAEERVDLLFRMERVERKK